MSHSNVGLCDRIDELDRRKVKDISPVYNVEVRTVLFPEPLGPMILDKLEIRVNYLQKPRDGCSRDDHIFLRQFSHLVIYEGNRRASSRHFVQVLVFLFVITTITAIKPSMM